MIPRGAADVRPPFVVAKCESLGLAVSWEDRVCTFWIPVDSYGTYWHCGPPWGTKIV